MKLRYFPALLAGALLPLAAAAQTDTQTDAQAQAQSQAQAQPEASTSTSTDNLALEEVIVTAQKRAESLQDTPISLTAFSSERLEVDGINNLNDIGSKVPSLTIEPFPINNATLRIFIRGIGLIDAQVTQDPPIGIYIDGAYIARSTGTALDVADLERIEILRGPQGTLYGRNTTGGAINLITKRPNPGEFEFKQKFTVGDRNLFTSKTSANIPLGDSAAIKLAYLYTETDGYVENGGPGGDWGDREVEGYRLDLRWDITDWLQLDYAYDKSDTEYYNYTYQAIKPSTFRNSVLDLIADQANSRVEAGPGYTDKRLDRLDSEMPLETSHTEIEGHALTLAADFDSFQLKYILAYRELYDAAYADLGSGAADADYRVDSHVWTAPDGTSYPLVVPQVSQDQLSHEFQISGNVGERLNYIVGAYYFEEEAEEDNRPAHHQFHSPIDDADVPGGSSLTIANIVSQFYTVDNEAWALFGQATWTPPILGDRLHLTFGARHSEDSRDAFKFIDDRVFVYSPLGTRTEATANPANCGGEPTCILVAGAIAGMGIPDPQKVYEAQRDKTFKDDSFTLVGEFDITDDINIYAKAVEAYKSGGFNTRDPHLDANSGGNDFGFGFAEGFEEEKVRSYEIGVKSELLNRRLRINGDIFFSEYTDIQLNFLVPGTVADTKVANAGEAEMQGLELDITYLYSRDLLLMLNYAYLDAEITEATDPTSGADVSDQFVFSAAPEHSYTAAADYTIAAGDWGRLALNVSYNYMDERNGGTYIQSVERGTRLGDYQLWNARLGVSEVSIGGGSLALAAWVKNALDEEYEITAIDNMPHADRSVIWGEPRSYGVDLIYQY